MAAPEIFLWGASRGQNAILRGQKSKNLLKMADFGYFFLLTGGAEPPTQWGAFPPPCPLDAATANQTRGMGGDGDGGWFASLEHFARLGIVI